jgi:hypothetical protein
MCRFVYGLLVLATVFQLCGLSGCDVDVNEPATPRVEVDSTPPPKVDVDVDVKKTNP